MKTYHIKDLLKKELLIIELPERYELAGVTNGAIYYYDNQMNHEDYPLSILVEGSYTLLGKPDKIKESDAELLVESWESVAKDGTKVFENYLTNIPKKRTAKESLLSAIESEIYWENPIPKPEIQGGYDDYGNFHGGWDDNWISAFEEAQEKTFDRNRSIIFKKIK